MNDAKNDKKEEKKDVRPDEKIESATENRHKALSTAIANIEKNFGKGAIMRFGDKSDVANADVVPTGSLSLDVALGIGGMPRGRIIEIYGPEASGKTTVTLHVVAAVQKFGGVAAFIDAEHALDPVYAKKLGVQIEDLYISQPDDGEQALDICEQLVRSHAVDVVVVDSVAALTPKAEIEGEMGGSHMGLHARLMSQALRKLTAIASKANCMIIFTNQLRLKIGVVYGSPETTTGGQALKFYASVRLDIRKAEFTKSGTDISGARTRVKVAKNKLAPPFKTCEFDIVYGEGISREGDVLDLACEIGVCSKAGSWFGYGDMRLGQGRENAKACLRENGKLLQEIEDKVRKHYKLKSFEELAEIHAQTVKNMSTDGFVKSEKGGKKKKPGKSGASSKEEEFAIDESGEYNDEE